MCERRRSSNGCGRHDPFRDGSHDSHDLTGFRDEVSGAGWQRIRTPRLASALSESSCFILRQDETAWRSTEPNR